MAAEGGTAGLGGLAGPSRPPAAAWGTPAPRAGGWIVASACAGLWPLWSPRRNGLRPRGGVGGQRLGSDGLFWPRPGSLLLASPQSPAELRLISAFFKSRPLEPM